MIDTKKVITMIEHWIMTRPNGYIGSNYGAPLQELLLKSQSTNVANDFITKMKQDLPLLKTLDDSQFSIFSENVGFERKQIYLSVGDIAINLSKVNQNNELQTGATYNANAS